MYYPDLSPYPDESSEEGHPTLSIGWLSAKRPYNRGEVSASFAERLWIFCCNPFFYTLGYHNCPFCQGTSFGILAQCGKEERRLGSAEIRVIGRGGVVYAAPDLIYHYVVEHHYCPPDEFIQAVLEGPLPGSLEYEALKKEKGWQ